HYGFGLAGIGMVLGQIVYMAGQKHLKHVGNFIGDDKDAAAKNNSPLSKIEKDRILVMLLSFAIIVVFWGAFEQAGGLMNIYTMEKIDRSLFGMIIPASVFQSANAFFIIVLGTFVAGIWAKRQLKGKESSTLFKMALGVIIMGTGFLAMSAAAIQADSSVDGKGAMIFLIIAYFLHTIGELFASPTALSFITKLAPAKYASLMMGAYFAATGFGSKLAAVVGGMAEGAGELQIFTGIFIFTLLFGGLILALLKPLKRLTHGAEDLVGTSNEEAEGFELADKEA
ncbi:MAG: MFS transporter, partial [Flavobacteriales bacterium]|nr:MFS transporter [Flavobacteriales bacterium]